MTGRQRPILRGLKNLGKRGRAVVAPPTSQGSRGRSCARHRLHRPTMGWRVKVKQSHFAHKRSIPKYFKFRCQEKIVYVCVKTVDKVLNEGKDPGPAMKHLKFASEKVSKKCFNFEAIAGYYPAVRDRVAPEGYSEFARTQTEEAFTSFSVENTVRKVEKASKASTLKLEGASSGICFHYHSDEGCKGKCYSIFRKLFQKVISKTLCNL